MIDIKKLEKTLIKSWTDFINVQDMMRYAHQIATNMGFASVKVKKLSITRFELISNGFVVWIDFIISTANKEVNITSEVFLTNTEFQHINSILNNID